MIFGTIGVVPVLALNVDHKNNRYFGSDLSDGSGSLHVVEMTAFIETSSFGLQLYTSSVHLVFDWLTGYQRIP